MSTPNCEQLDDYIGGELSADSCLQFERHLADCDECRGAADDWIITRELVRDASMQLEVAQASLLESITNATGLAQPAKREVNSVPWGRVAALLAACVLVGVLLSTMQWRIPEPVEVATRNPRVIDIVQSKEVRLPDDVLGVPIDIGDPDVTIVWVYPTRSPDVSAN